MTAIQITAKELNEFWDNVLGPGTNWYLEEGADWECDEPPEAVITIESYAHVAWQGRGKEEPVPLMVQMQNRGVGDIYNLQDLITEWRKFQVSTYLTVEVPNDKLEAIKAFLKDNGATLVGQPSA